jgi:hypothetical protein
MACASIRRNPHLHKEFSMSKRLVLAFGLGLVASAVFAANDPPSAVPAKPTAKAAAKAPAKATSTAAAKAAPPATPPAPKLPAMTAAQIVDRNLAARGGLPAWRAVNTLTMEGQLDAGGTPNVELPFTMRMKRGHKSRLEIVVHEQTAVQVFDGTQGWKVRPFLNRTDVEPYTAAEAKSAANAEELDGPLIDYTRKGTRIELAGTETIEGNDTYRLKLTLKNGEQRTVWIDGKNFLERKIDGEPRKMDGKLRKVALYYRAFQTENGLTTPRAVETVVEGMKPTRMMKITKVTLNEPMADSLFQKPQGVPAAAPKKK